MDHLYNRNSNYIILKVHSELMKPEFRSIIDLLKKSATMAVNYLDMMLLFYSRIEVHFLKEGKASHINKSNIIGKAIE